MVVGLGRLNRRTVALLGQQKGRDTRTRSAGTTGWPYRRAIARPCGPWTASRSDAVSDHLAGRYARRIPRSRGGAARAGRRHCTLAVPDEQTDGADRCLCDRRGRLGRGDRDRACRPGTDAGERDVLRDLAGRMRRDPLAGRRGEGQGCGGSKPDAVHTLELGVIDAAQSCPSRKAAPTNWDENWPPARRGAAEARSDLSNIPGENFAAVGATTSARWASMRRPQRPQRPQLPPGLSTGFAYSQVGKRRFSGPGSRGKPGAMR